VGNIYVLEEVLVCMGYGDIKEEIEMILDFGAIAIEVDWSMN